MPLLFLAFTMLSSLTVCFRVEVQAALVAQLLGDLLPRLLQAAHRINQREGEELLQPQPAAASIVESISELCVLRSHSVHVQVKQQRTQQQWDGNATERRQRYSA
jgi:hypothetical protein